MRKVILGLAITLDGFIEGPNGEYDWCFTDQDYGLNEFMNRIDAIIMGRKSYEVAQKYEEQNPWKGIKTYVFSNTMKEAGADAEIVSGDVLEMGSALKQKEGKDIWLFGGAALTEAFMAEDLIDEFWLSIHPILLGSGKMLFQNSTSRKHMKLKEHKIYSTGLVSLTYERERA